MDVHQGGQASPNGHHQQPGGPSETAQPRFFEDEAGATMDSGAAVCRFNPLRGGRLERWQWRVVPPTEALAPHGKHQVSSLIDLVNPEGGALVDHFFPLRPRPQEIAEAQYRE